MTESILLLAGSLAAGALGGLLGVGGGIILMPLLRFGVGLGPAAAAGTCIVGVLCTTLGGSYRHYRLGHVDLRAIEPLIAAGAVATLACSLLFPRLTHNDRWLDLGMGLVFSLVTAHMIVTAWRGEGNRDGDGSNEAPGGDTRGTQGTLVKKLAIGAAGGVLPGLLGIGTGVILVPAFHCLLRMPIKNAVGASLICFCSNALISAAAKLAQGYVDLSVVLPTCVGALIGANLGAVINHRSPSRAVKLLFGLVFGLVSARFIISFWGGQA